MPYYTHVLILLGFLTESQMKNVSSICLVYESTLEMNTSLRVDYSYSINLYVVSLVLQKPYILCTSENEALSFSDRYSNIDIVANYVLAYEFPRLDQWKRCE